MSEKDLFKVQKPKIHRNLAGMGGGSFEIDPKCDSLFFLDFRHLIKDKYRERVKYCDAREVLMRCCMPKIS